MGLYNHLSSTIKTIYLELPNYHYYHSPSARSAKTKSDKRLIKRKKLQRQMLDLLKNSNTRSGAYLVAGYRGMGKTSLVREVIKEFKGNSFSGIYRIFNKKWWSEVFKGKLFRAKNKVYDIEFSLAQDDLKDSDILKHITRKVYVYFDSYINNLFFTWVKRGLFLAYYIASSYFLVMVFLHKTNSNMLTNLSQIIGKNSYVLKLSFGQCDQLFCVLVSSILPYTLLVILGGLVLRFLLYYKPIHPSQRHLAMIRNLYDSVNSQITYERHEELGKGVGKQLFNFSRRKTAVRPLATAKEIEYELIKFLGVLSEYDNRYADNFWVCWNAYLKRKFRFLSAYISPQFIIVFDELDKIEPVHDSSIVKKEMEDPYLDRSDSILVGTNSARKKQEALAKLLTNLKHFLNVAEAKFFFIAGREMYDASLADSSDRESFFGSIFHAVFYIPSFYHDSVNEGSFGITQMTENYLCRLLIDEENHLKDKPLDITEYHNYLETHCSINCSKEEKERKEDEKRKKKEIQEGRGKSVENQNNEEGKEGYWSDLQKQKVISTLLQLIMYLTYRSNGMPKKLTTIFEEFISLEKPDELFEDMPGGLNNNLVVLSKNTEQKGERHFLKITNEDQYRIGLINQLIRPYIITQERYLQKLSDKLLVSFTYLIDHLFKFHRHGFSWRNIELTPEIIAFNKSPELRVFVKGLIEFLSHNQLRDTNYGLFQYKFFKRVSNELDYVSKISEPESAALNFTLDESIFIKRYFHQKLEKLKTYYKDESGTHIESHINPIGFISSLLGDLYYFDREYDDAIIHYTSSLQVLRYKDIKQLGNVEIFHYVRDKLKLILTLEKMHAFDSATIHSIQLSNDLTYFLKGKILKGFTFDSPEGDKIERNKAISEVFNVSIFILPFINELAIIEKTTSIGIASDNFKENRKRFFGIINQTDRGYGIPYFKSLYKLHVGTLLFLKNGNIMKNYKDTHIVDQDTDENTCPDYASPVSAFESYCDSLKLMCKAGPAITTEKEELEEKLSEYSAYFNTTHDLNKSISKLIHLLVEPSRKARYITLSKAENEHIGSLLTKLGDSIVLLIGKLDHRQITISFLESLLEMFQNREKSNDYSGFSKVNLTEALKGKYLGNGKRETPQLKSFSFDLAFFFYFLSSYYYRRAGRYNNYTLQINKMLYLIRDYMQVMKVYLESEKRKIDHDEWKPDYNLKKGEFLPWEEQRKIWEKCDDKWNEYFKTVEERFNQWKKRYDNWKERYENWVEHNKQWKEKRGEILTFLLGSGKSSLITKSLRMGNVTNQTTGRVQVLQMENILQYPAFETNKKAAKGIYNLVSTAGFHKEIISLFNDTLLFAVEDMDDFNQIRKHFTLKTSPVNGYSSINNQYSRILELQFKVHFNYQYLKFSGLLDAFELIDSYRKLQFKRVGENFKKEDLKRILKERYEDFIKVRKVNKGRVLLDDGFFDRFIKDEELNDSISINQDKYFKLIGVFKKNLAKEIKSTFLSKRLEDENVKKILNDFSDEQDREENTAKKDEHKVLRELGDFLISDSINALIELNNILDQFGISYMYNHSYQGFTRQLLGRWCRWHQHHITVYYPREDFHQDPLQLKEKIGVGIIKHLDPKYHFERAISHFTKSIEMHNEGKAYREHLNELYYLEEDLNDNQYHFHATLERFRINFSLIRTQITKLKKEARSSRFYAYDYYVNTEM